MPQVPNVPGVPPLSSYATYQTVLLTADVALNVFQALQPQWGLYKDGNPVLVSSLPALLGLGGVTGAINSISNVFGVNTFSSFSIVDFEYKQNWTVSDYPVEDGGFQSYDKVQLPFDIRLRVAAGGTKSNRQALLTIVDALTNTLDLYDVVTPEKVYKSCNIDHYDYNRKSQSGVGLIIVDLWLRQIRVTATATTQSAQQPYAQGQQNTGNVLPRSVPPSFLQRFFS